jgi:hypothetical protein
MCCAKVGVLRDQSHHEVRKNFVDGWRERVHSRATRTTIRRLWVYPAAKHLEVTMADRSSPAVVLASTIKALEEEVRTALAACPARQRFEVEKLRERLERLKAAAVLSQPRAPHRRVSAR